MLFAISKLTSTSILVSLDNAFGILPPQKWRYGVNRCRVLSANLSLLCFAFALAVLGCQKAANQQYPSPPPAASSNADNPAPPMAIQPTPTPAPTPHPQATTTSSSAAPNCPSRHCHFRPPRPGCRLQDQHSRPGIFRHLPGPDRGRRQARHPQGGSRFRFRKRRQARWKIQRRRCAIAHPHQHYRQEPGLQYPNLHAYRQQHRQG